MHVRNISRLLNIQCCFINQKWEDPFLAIMDDALEDNRTDEVKLNMKQFRNRKRKMSFDFIVEYFKTLTSLK